MKPGPPAKAGPAPPAGADGNCNCSGRGSLQLNVVREFGRVQHPNTYWYSGQTGGTTGAASHRQAVLRRARPRDNTCPEPGRPHPPASTRSPVLVGRTGRESPKPRPPPRPSPGTPVGSRVQNKLMYDDIKYTPGLTGPQSPVRVRPAGWGPQPSPQVFETPGAVPSGSSPPGSTALPSHVARQASDGTWSCHP